MGDDGLKLNIRNWGYYEPPFKGNLVLQLMSTAPECNTPSFLSGRKNGVLVNTNSAFRPRDFEVSDAAAVDYMRSSWENQKEKFLNILPRYAVKTENSRNHDFQMVEQPVLPRDNGMVGMERLGSKMESEPTKKRTIDYTSKSPKPKKMRKSSGFSKDNGGTSTQCVKQTKKSVGVVINGLNMDFSVIPTPVCSCTGVPQQCYRWGCGGWQSACCTTSVSLYPLPMSTKRHGTRIAGRKMSQGAFNKVLEKLAAEGYDFSNQIDLRTHWAKHGTNKFVTIK